MYAIKQIKICEEYRDMLPRPRLDLSGTPGLRPIGLSPGSWQTSLGLGSMSRYSAQILICITYENLSFNEHISVCCTKAARQLNTLARIAKYLDVQSRRTIYNSFIMSIFNYFILVWHFVEKRTTQNSKKYKIELWESFTMTIPPPTVSFSKRLVPMRCF